MGPSVSVVLCSYNGELFIEEQIWTILNQSFPVKELIISDDCSTDKTIEIIKKFNCAKIKYHVNHERLGYTQNFSNAALKATGDLIAFCDQDDIWYQNKIFDILESFRESGKRVLLNNADLLIDEEIKGNQFDQYIAAGISKRHWGLGCCITVERGYFLKYGIVPTGFVGHDSWLLPIAFVMGELHFIEKPLQIYRRHKNTITKTFLCKKTIISQIIHNKNSLLSAKVNYSIDRLEQDLFLLKIRHNWLLNFFAKNSCQDTKNLKDFENEVFLEIKILKQRIYNINSEFINFIYHSIILYLRSGNYYKTKTFVKDLISYFYRAKRDHS